MYQSLTSTRRILCLSVPRFAAIAAGAVEDEPRALIAQRRQMMVIHSTNRTAQNAGVVPGMALSDARAFATGLKTVELDPPLVQSAAKRLALWLSRYSPLVGHDPLGDPLALGGEIGFWIDISGVAHLFGGEQNMLQDLTRRLAHMNLPDACMAIAPTPGAAWAAARFCGRAQATITARDVRSMLYPLPPAALRLDDKTLEALDRLGLRRISDIIKLPRAELGQRFPRHAESLLWRLDQALGDIAESVEPLLPPSPYACRRLYPEPVQHKQAVLGGLQEGLDAVIKSLERDQQGARQIDLHLFRVDGHCMVISVKTHTPTRDQQSLMRLFDGKLEGLDVGFGLDALVVAIAQHSPLAYEQTSLLTQSRHGARAAVFDRIANRLGEDAVRQFQVEASHTPGADVSTAPLGTAANTATNTAPNTATTDDASAWRRAYRDRVLVGLDQDAPAADQGRVAVRKGKLLAQPPRSRSLPRPLPLPPPPLQGPSPRPLHLFVRPEPVPFQRQGTHQATMTWRRIQHRLVDIQGPERITADWWKAHIACDPAASAPRDYYRVQDVDGRGFYLFEILCPQHKPTGEWHVAGLM